MLFYHRAKNAAGASTRQSCGGVVEFDFEQAQQFASEIEQYNSDRKDLDKQITKEALQIEVNEEKDGLPQSSIKKTGTKA
jgi:single-stranded DNA-specific DHH superfamily exonuclease